MSGVATIEAAIREFVVWLIDGWVVAHRGLGSYAEQPESNKEIIRHANWVGNSFPSLRFSLIRNTSGSIMNLSGTVQ